MASEKPTPTVEDYLCIIYTLKREGNEVYGAKLAEILNVSPPTVTATIQRMVRDGWINYSTSKKISLTKIGTQAARSVIRRHMLTEWMLSKILNIPWSDIHEEADKLEHSISPDIEKSLSAVLNDPDFCPHGNPFPGSEEISENWIPLLKFSQKKSVIIRRIHEFLEDNLDAMRFLEEKNVLPGHVFTIKQIIPFNKTLTISGEKNNVTLGFEIANLIYAEDILKRQ